MEKILILALAISTLIGWSKWFFLNQKYKYFVFKYYKEEIDKCKDLDELKDLIDPFK